MGYIFLVILFAAAAHSPSLDLEVKLPAPRRGASVAKTSGTPPKQATRLRQGFGEVTLRFLPAASRGASARRRVRRVPLALGQEEKRLLAKGRVIILEQSHGQPKGRVEAAILIDAPVERVWSAMVDCDRAPDFVPGLKGCRVLRRDGNSLIIEHQVRVSWLLPMVTYVFRADYQRYKRIDFKRVSGGLKELEGSWALENINGGRQTIVMYSVYLDPGFYVPQWLVRLILKGDLPDLLTALRNRVSVSSQR